MGGEPERLGFGSHPCRSPALHVPAALSRNGKTAALLRRGWGPPEQGCDTLMNSRRPANVRSPLPSKCQHVGMLNSFGGAE